MFLWRCSVPVQYHVRPELPKLKLNLFYVPKNDVATADFFYFFQPKAPYESRFDYLSGELFLLFFAPLSPDALASPYKDMQARLMGDLPMGASSNKLARCPGYALCLSPQCHLKLAPALCNLAKVRRISRMSNERCIADG